MFTRKLVTGNSLLYVYTFEPTEANFEVHKLKNNVLIALDGTYLIGQYTDIHKAYDGIKDYVFGAYPPAA